MAKAARQLFEEAIQMEPMERVALIELLVESLDPDSEDGAEAAWLRELDRRIAELDTGGVKSVPWKDLRARLVGG
ncbi:MAG TPA: addiction module protein [bacterium]|nr:addiction module protein [bacterium]